MFESVSMMSSFSGCVAATARLPQFRSPATSLSGGRDRPLRRVPGSHPGLFSAVPAITGARVPEGYVDTGHTAGPVAPPGDWHWRWQHPNPVTKCSPPVQRLARGSPSRPPTVVASPAQRR
jgi:hypothetical protein